MRTMRRRVVAMSLLVGLALGLGVVAELMKRHGLDWAAKISEIASFAVALVGFVLPSVPWLANMFRERRPLTSKQVREARDSLAAALSEGWQGEEPSASDALQILPMHVRFAPLSEDVVSDVAAHPNSPIISAQTPGAVDEFASVRESFSGQPPYRRVVLGKPGAGKTILITELAEQLLETAGAEDPLPVVLSAAAWDPERASLRMWVVRQLARGYALPMRQAEALAAGGHVMPVLDGLDEMPERLRPAALARINEYRIGRPLVVTSRPEEYFQAAHEGAGVHNAAVVELLPLQVSDITSYLKSVGGDRWAAVIKRLDSDPAGPLAQALGNPLMLWLATAVYAERRPDELMDGILLGSRASIEQHLLDELVPAVYSARSQLSSPGFRCTLPQAQRWLGFLAGQSKRAYDDRLAWWRLSTTLSWKLLGMAIRGALLFSAASWALVWVLAAHGNWRRGAPSGPVNFGNLLLAGPAGQRYIRPAASQLVSVIPSATRHKGQVDLDHFFQAISPFFWLILIIAAALVALLFWPDSFPWPRRLKIRPIAVLTRVLTGTALCAFAFYGVAWLIYAGNHSHHRAGTAAAFTTAHWPGLIAVSLIALAWIPSSFVTWADTSGTISPSQSLRLDRQADIVTTVSRRSVIAAVIWLCSGLQVAVAYVVFAATATLVAVFAGGRGKFESRCYTDAHLWLACQGRLPWRTMAFLADAERRGVLRQVGAAYQFRHVRVQEQLATLGLHISFRYTERWRSLTEAFADAARELTGRHDETLAATLDALDRARSIAQTRPTRLPPGFTELIDHLDFQLFLSARTEKALDGLRNISEIYRRLSEVNPDEYTARLSGSLARFTLAARSSGRFQETLQIAKWVVDAHRRQALRDEATLPDLAKSLAYLADLLSESDRREEAVRMSGAAVDVCRKLAASDPATYGPKLARSLSLAAARLYESDRAQEALDPIQEAVHVYNNLGPRKPDFGIPYQQALTLLADTFHALGRKDEELAAVRAAFLANRQRADQMTTMRLETTKIYLTPLLAQDAELASCSGIADHTAPDQEITRAAVADAAAACRDLIKANPEIGPDAIYAMHGIASRLNSAGSRAEARALLSDMSELELELELDPKLRSSWTLKPEKPEHSLPDSPYKRMAGLALRMWKLGAYPEAIEAGAEAGIRAPAIPSSIRAPSTVRRGPLVLDRPETRDEPSESRWVQVARRNVRRMRWRARKDKSSLKAYSEEQEDLAESTEDYGDYLDTLAFRLKAAGNVTDADAVLQQSVKAREEAVDIYRELSGRYHGRYYLLELAASLDTLAYQLKAAGSDEAASEASHEAQEIRRIASSETASVRRTSHYEQAPLQEGRETIK